MSPLDLHINDGYLPMVDVPASTTADSATGRPTLLRLPNANYFPVNVRFSDSAGRPVPMAELISHDGRPFRDTSSPTAPAWPISATGHLRSAIINIGAAERYDILLHPPASGTYWLTVDLLDWITEKVLFTRRIPVVTA